MFITHYLKAMDIREALPKPQLKQNRKYLCHLCGAVFSLSILVLIKELYGLLFGAILLDQWWRKASRKSYLFWIGLGGFLLIVMAILNYEAYGMIFLGRNRLHHDPFSNEAALGLQYLGPRIKDYLFSLNWSVWFNFPLLLFAIFGYPAAFPYFKKMLRFILLCLGIFSIFLLNFYSRGEWCYGSRYYLFILPVLSLPAVFVLAKIITLPKKWAVSISLLLLAMAGINIYGQCLINDREVFMSYSMSAIWEVHGLQSKYFDERPRMLVMYDLRQMFYHLKNGPLFEQLFAENISHEEKREILHEMLQKYFAYRRNYWLLPNVKPRAADYR